MKMIKDEDDESKSMAFFLLFFLIDSKVIDMENNSVWFRLARENERKWSDRGVNTLLSDLSGQHTDTQ